MKIYKSTNSKKQWCLDTRERINKKEYGRRYFFRTRAEAEGYFRFLIKTDQLNHAEISKTSDMLISDLFKKYARSKRINKKETTRDKLSRYNNYLSVFMDGKKLMDLDKDFLSSLSEYIRGLKSKETNEPLSQNVQYRLWQDVKSMINFAYDEEIIDYIVKPKRSAEIKKPKSSDEIEVWSSREFKLFIDAVDDELLKTVFYVLAYCGLRKSEMRGLKFKNINFVNHQILIRTQLKSGRKGDESLKTLASKRNVDVPEMVMKRLETLKDERLMTGISEEKLGEEYVFVDKKGNVIPAETLRRKYKKYVEKAGIRYLPLHALRHYFGTYLSSHGTSVALTQRQMGHSRNDTTVLKHYVSITEEERRKYIEMMDKSIAESEK